MYLPSIFSSNFFDDLMEFPFGTRHARRSGSSSSAALGLMKTDVRETSDSYLVDIDLPGFRKEDVKASLKEGYLTVTATREENRNADTENRYLRRERYMGSVSRSFYVGEALTEADIKARFEDGILKITLPKKDEKKAEENRFITIEG
ncbi:MAG: Hsp20/alpha crystallin family protein [Lachnospiraceae bacterium]|nr:Hsp20/alpha crystallin family protein [Lachnospiraceae bacterium]